MSLIYPVNAISLFSTLYLWHFSFIDGSVGVINKQPSDILTNWISFYSSSDGLWVMVLYLLIGLILTFTHSQMIDVGRIINIDLYGIHSRTLNNKLKVFDIMNLITL